MNWLDQFNNASKQIAKAHVVQERAKQEQQRQSVLTANADLNKATVVEEPTPLLNKSTLIGGAVAVVAAMFLAKGSKK